MLLQDCCFFEFTLFYAPYRAFVIRMKNYLQIKRELSQN